MYIFMMIGAIVCCLVIIILLLLWIKMEREIRKEELRYFKSVKDTQEKKIEVLNNIINISDDLIELWIKNDNYN